MTVAWSQCNSQSYTGLVASKDVSLIFVFRDTRACPYDHTDANVTCNNSMIKQGQAG